MHGREYQVLLNNIPGGVLQCLNDEKYTIAEVNQGFFDMFGFSEEELAQRFGGQFTEMIHPEDRWHVREEVELQLKKGDRLALSYRVICDKGYYKWVTDITQLIRDEDGEEKIFCVILDDTEARNAREELRLTMERHRIIMDQTTDIIFEWDIQDKKISYSENWKKKFGYLPDYTGPDALHKARSHVHPEDVPILMEAMERTKGISVCTTVDFRIRNVENKFIWCRVRFTNQCDENGKPVKAVGIITDIDQEKRAMEELRRRAERDALTGLYNREETERQIRCHIESRPNKLCALFMIDTDNFKQVNDRQGHLFGDAVLSELAAAMQKMIRKDDVVGRIGGDEFVIFLKDISSVGVAEQKAAELREMFQRLFREEKQLVEITCSIGVAIYPKDGDSFHSLYHSADIALYHAKSQGKNQYVVFDSADAASVDQVNYSSLGTVIDSDRHTSGGLGNLVNYVFQILYDSNDINHAIQTILEIVGIRFDVSRAYVFENSEDGRYTDNTYEWCNEGILSQKDRLQHYPYESIDGYEDLFLENSVFYCSDIYSLKPDQIALFESQGVIATLQCELREHGRFCGFVGFDECTGKRRWTGEEVGMLSLIARVLTTFLQVKRVTNHERQLAIRLNTILDAQDAYIYAIRADNHELLYLNHKTKELDPKITTGMVCYDAFFGTESPCDFCPLCGSTDETFYPRYQRWCRVKVTPMRWGDYDAFLMSCYDRTNYKNLQDKCRENDSLGTERMELTGF